MRNGKKTVIVDAATIMIEYLDGTVYSDDLDGVGAQAITDKIMEIDLRHAQDVGEAVPV